MAKYKFEVHYSGPALENNSIPVKDLAPSLLSLSEAFQTIQKIEHPNEEPLSLNISATKKGSFIAELFLVNGPDLLNHVINILNSNPSQALLNLTTYTGIFIEVIKVIQQIAKKKIKDKSEEDGKVTLTLDDKTKLTMSEAAFRTYRNLEFRKEVNEIVKPLKNEGIESVGFSHDEKMSVIVSHSDYSKFDVPSVKEKHLETNDATVYLQIINVAFEHGKWKFSMGDSQFFADIDDEQFLKSVEKNEEQFGSTDALKVKLRTAQYLDKNGNLKTNYTIVKVLEHIKGSEQIGLDLFDEDDENN